MAQAQHGVSFPAHKVLKVSDDGFADTSTEFAVTLLDFSLITVREKSQCVLSPVQSEIMGLSLGCLIW